MGTQPSSRKDGFGTEGIGEDGDADMGQNGHASQGGTAGGSSGGTQGHDAGSQRRHKNEANKGPDAGGRTATD